MLFSHNYSSFYAIFSGFSLNIGTYTPRIQINAVLVFIISRYWSKSIIRRALPSAFQSSFNHFARPLDRKERISPGSQLKTNRICQFGLFYSKIYYKMGVLQIKRGVFWMLLDGMCDVNALFGRFLDDMIRFGRYFSHNQ